MKGNISSKELIDGVKSWLASLTDEEWCKKLEEENYFNELDEKQRLEWLGRKTIRFQHIPDSISYVVTVNDEEDFNYTSHDKLNSLSIPISNKKVFVDSEAA